jgi:hypothetical protein
MRAILVPLSSIVVLMLVEHEAYDVWDIGRNVQLLPNDLPQLNYGQKSAGLGGY